METETDVADPVMEKIEILISEIATLVMGDDLVSADEKTNELRRTIEDGLYRLRKTVKYLEGVLRMNDKLNEPTPPAPV